MKDDYLILDLPSNLPGCLGVIARESRMSALRVLEKTQEPRRYVVRAITSDQIPLAGGIEHLLAPRVPKLIRLGKNPLTMSLDQGGRDSVFFDLCANEEGFLSHIDVEVEASLPSNTLAPAHTVLNALLDRLVGSSWMPLVISRLDLYIKGENEPLAHQLLLPFNESLSLGPRNLGAGIISFPIFDPYESLIREAITSTSPFYRFLCAYRLYEGMNILRKALRDLKSNLAVSADLPSDPKIDKDMLIELGFSPSMLEGVRTVRDFHGKLTKTRNRIAHFLLRGGDFIVNTSNGAHYVNYAVGGAVLLHYAHMSLTELRRYYSSHLYSITQRGQILPMMERRDMFIVRAP